jgi:hypothetical protein
VTADNEEEEEVVIHTTEVVGQAEDAVLVKPRHYERTAPLPSRVRDGSFEDAHLIANGEEIPYQAVKYLAVGVIDQMVKAGELKKGPLQKMVKKVTGGEETDSAKDRAKQVREIYMLDVFTDLQQQPFRFAGGTINYKSFLDKVGYVSHHNFYRFCVHFARRVPHATVTASTVAFLERKREKVAHFNDYHDFELEVIQQIRFNRDLLSLDGLDLSRDSWVEEWTLDDI